MSKKLTLLSTSMLAGIIAFSQQDTLHGNPLDQVIVTANKTEQKQSTTGKVVTVIGKDQIEKSAGKTVAQILNDQAGITINGALNNAGSVQTLYIRGAASGRALILIDGIPASDPSMINNEYDLNLFSINDVERIEICKGAQSTLYGSDAVAGVINIITIKSNVTKPFNLKTTVAGGSFGTFKGNVQLYGKANKLSYTARYAKLVTDGFSSAYDSTGTKNFDKDGYNGDAVSAALQYQATKKLLFKAFSQFSEYKSGVDASVFADKSNYDINNKTLNTGTGFQYKNDVLTLVGNYQYNYTQRNYNDNASVPGATSFSLNNFNAISQFAELYANIKLGNGFDVLVGADYRYNSFNSTYNSLSVYGPYNSVFPDTSVHQTSAFASLHFATVSKKINVELGARVNQHSRYGTNTTFTFNPSYQFNKSTRIFGSISSGFKVPSLYQLYAGVPFGPGNPDLKPEASTNYEAGIQWQQKTVSARLVYFNRIIKNGIDYLSQPYPTPSLYINYIKQIVNGIEFEINVRPTDKININANYTYLSPNETTQNRITNKDTVTYNYLLRRPANSFNLTAGIQASKALYASVSGKYVGKRYDVGGYQKADISLADYFLLSAYAEYQICKCAKFFVDAQNITNKKFFDVRGYNSIPFMLNAGVTIHL